ncbi:50S ribosomal protein L2 [candidate division WWE3 bacterium CG_4_10_14_0_2_um_filter_42_7]|uniref:Large ribosomal subunit protein uL2 n=2 Tax=Katanobacteria TaxID=422282 RepID=A0A2H0XAT7_UNCKA|nr:MAG: 50S ribosomal protein L2 [candidate division WWE3 bacterium CG08_land_8_20_14_0_20_41_15]PIZ42948.1 MAG: 50S ribosomal protein L2 [candidate division WWE3 bacterium CG_4_10_14_0_2_um_filter_42_7]
MATRTFTPTSSGRRQKIALVRDNLTKGAKREKSLTVPYLSRAGRNNLGRVTVRHQGSGEKQMYRIIDFKRRKLDIPARVASIEYDPHRGPDIALLFYVDGEKRYIIAPIGLKVNDMVMSGPTSEIKVGNALPLASIPLGVPIHNVEIQPGRGGQLARSAGTSLTVSAKEDKYALVKLPSGEIRKILLTCYATIGVASNEDLKNVVLGKAGLHRRQGVRPAVRGVAMNPRDHPHGGGEGRSSVGLKAPKTPWGKRFRGIKTRRRNKTNVFIVARRGSTQ